MIIAMKKTNNIPGKNNKREKNTDYKKCSIADIVY